MAIKIPQQDVAGGLKPIYHLPSCAGSVAGLSHRQEKSVASFLSTGANCCPRVPKQGHLLLVVSLSPPGPTWPWDPVPQDTRVGDAHLNAPADLF